MASDGSREGQGPPAGQGPAQGRRSGREVARRVLRRIATQGAYASLALDGELERARSLSDAERRLATELVYGVLRHDARIDRALVPLAPRGLGSLSPAALIALRVGAYQILFLDRVPDHAAVNDAVFALRRIGGAPLAGFGNRTLRELTRRREPALPPRDDPSYAEVACSLPPWIVRELAAVVAPDALADAADALIAVAPLWIRVNALRAERDAVAAALVAERPRARIEPAAVSPDALAAIGLGNPDTCQTFQFGLWTVQDLGAQLVTRLCGAAPGERILDACAGVGGKTTYLAELGANKVSIDAADLSRRKLDLLDDTVRRMGTAGVRAHEVDLTQPGAALAADYDAVLLDAPCSGLGVLRRHPEAKRRVTPQTVADMQELQRRLLAALAERVRPGGRLVYSVCTFTRAEGPDQVARFVADHPGFVPEAELRAWPHADGADAFFAVRLRRT